MSLHHAPLFTWKSRRLHLLLMVMFGLFNSQYMNTNLGITITCMVNYTAVDDMNIEMDNETMLTNVTVVSSCGQKESGEKLQIDYGGTLVWDRAAQNWLFSASFWGASATVIPSILFSHRFSPRILLAVSMAIKAVANALLPLLARTKFSFYGVFGARFMLGMAEPFIYPAINTMIGNWFPVEERSTAVALFTTGNQLAMFIGNPIAAWLCSSKLGWPAVYYLSAVLGFFWLALWMSFAHNRPSHVKWMMRRERIYLLKMVPRRQPGTDHPRPPFLALATNPAYLSHLFATYAISVAATFMMTYLPTYFKQVLLLGLIANGTFTSIPMMFNFSFKVIWGLGVDKLKRRGYLTPTQGVKLSQCFPTFGVAIPLLFVMVFVNCERAWLALLLFCISNMFMGGHTSGAYTSLLSLAPQYTPTLTSISQAFSMISQLTSPFIVHSLITKGTAEEWNRMLLFTSVLCIVSGIQFLIWGSGEIQDFAKSDEEEAAVEEPPKKKILLTVGDEEREIFLRPLKNSFRADSVSLM